jgi:hypothetical protein
MSPPFNLRQRLQLSSTRKVKISKHNMAQTGSHYTSAGNTRRNVSDGDGVPTSVHMPRRGQVLINTGHTESDTVTSPKSTDDTHTHTHTQNTSRPMPFPVLPTCYSIMASSWLLRTLTQYLRTSVNRLHLLKTLTTRAYRLV